MADPVDRDRQVEQLLRRMSPARPSTACIDAEQMAAWADGGLQGAQATLVEGHLADCAHCQAMLAAFVSSAPPEPAAVPLWHRWRLQWLVPVATASVVVFGWTMVTRDAGDVPPPSTTVARVEPAEPPRFESAAPVVPTAGSASAQRVNQAADAVPEEVQPGAFTTSAPQGLAPSLPSAAAAPAPPAPPLPAASGAPPDRRAAVASAGARVQDTQQSAPGSFSLSSAETQQMDAAAVDDSVPVHARVDVPGPVEFRAPARLSRATSVVAVRPSTTTWRIGPDGRVSRSSDGGRTWSAVALDPVLFITAGSAPLDEVCWLVDRGGAVLRSTNGVDFQRTTFAAPAAPVSVLAVDALQATVVTDDGRVFMTTNGGATWTQMP